MASRTLYRSVVALLEQYPATGWVLPDGRRFRPDPAAYEHAVWKAELDWDKVEVVGYVGRKRQVVRLTLRRTGCYPDYRWVIEAR